MAEIGPLLNSTVLMNRADIELILEALVATQRTMSEAAAIILERLDNIDGDPDAESGNDLEDDFMLSNRAMEYDGGPGCPAADVDAGAYVEWSSLSPTERKREHNRMAGHEDAEEDDPAGQCDEDGINTAHDLVRYTSGSNGAGCPIADPGGREHDGREPEHG